MKMKMSLGPEALAIPSPVWVVGSYGNNEQPNIMVVAWGAICCTTPPCISIAIKKTRATYSNIMEHEAFTISVPSREYLIETDYVGMVSGISYDKFSASGLTPVRSKVVDAPYVDEFPLIMECSLLHMLEIGSHTQFIGQIMDVKADEEVLGENGLPIAQKVDPLVSSACERAYYGLGEYVERACLLGGNLLEPQLEEEID